MCVCVCKPGHRTKADNNHENVIAIGSRIHTNINCLYDDARFSVGAQYRVWPWLIVWAFDCTTHNAIHIDRNVGAQHITIK